MGNQENKVPTPGISTQEIPTVLPYEEIEGQGMLFEDAFELTEPISEESESPELTPADPVHTQEPVVETESEEAETSIPTEEPEFADSPTQDTIKQPSSKRTIFIGAGIGGAVVALLGGGMWLLGPKEKSDADSTTAPTSDPSKTEQVITTPEPATSETVVDVSDVPEEARSFVETYGDRYFVPVETYRAETALEQSGSPSAMVEDSFVAQYEFPEYSAGETSPLGFESMTFAFDSDLTKENFAELFNEQAIPNLNLLMDLLARNPGVEARDVIVNELKIYCGASGDSSFENLVATLQGIVDRYGPAANYRVSEITATDTPSEDVNTISFDPQIDSVDADGNLQAFSTNINNALEVNIDIYNADGSFGTFTEELPNFAPIFIYEKVTGTRDTAPGYVAIGSH